MDWRKTSPITSLHFINYSVLFSIQHIFSTSTIKSVPSKQLEITMKIYKTIFLLALVAVISNPVMAHQDHDGYSKFDQRIERQQKRIKKGVRHGELTKRESHKLRKQHRHIKKLNRLFKKDGHLTRFERQTLKRELNLASQRINQLKHNDRYRDNDFHDHRPSKRRHTDHYQRTRHHDHGSLNRINYRLYF